MRRTSAAASGLDAQEQSRRRSVAHMVLAGDVSVAKGGAEASVDRDTERAKQRAIEHLALDHALFVAAARLDEQHVKEEEEEQRRHQRQLQLDAARRLEEEQARADTLALFKHDAGGEFIAAACL